MRWSSLQADPELILSGGVETPFAERVGHIAKRFEDGVPQSKSSLIAEGFRRSWQR